MYSPGVHVGSKVTCVWTLACADPDFSGDFLQSSTLPYNLAVRGGLTV